MKKNQKLLGLLLALVLVFGAIGIYFGTKPQEGVKSIVLEVVSVRDDVETSDKVKTDKEYLGELLIEKDMVTYDESQYGMYIRGINGLMDDSDNQYWWCILVDGESAVNGADTLILEDGKTYTLELKQGW